MSAAVRQASTRVRRIAKTLRAAPPHIADRLVGFLDELATSLEELALAVDLLADEAESFKEAHR